MDSMETSLINTRSYPVALSSFTWIIVLLVSDLPNAIWQALGGEPPAWLFWIKVGVLLAVLLGSLGWKLIQPVRSYFLLLLVLLLGLWGMNFFRQTEAYLQWEKQTGWVMAMVAFQSLKMAVTIIMIATLLLLGKRRKDFFFAPGQLDAPVRPAGERTTGRRSLSWRALGLILGLCIAPLTLLFFGMGSFPTANVLTKALPFIPLALVFAATNAFSEEVQFRASFLGDLENALGDTQAIWLSAVFFGLAHYFGGAPSGIPGVLITGLLGALFAKCMLGSRGLAVPWFIHFCQNAVIYAFWAFNSIS